MQKEGNVMKKFFTNLILFLVITIATARAAVLNDETAKIFVSGLTNDVLLIIEDKSLNADAKYHKLSQMFIDNVDTKWISRFVLGANYRSLTPEQQEEFADLYTKFLVNVYVPKFKDYHKDKVIIQDVDSSQENVVKVNTILDRHEKEDVKINYMLKINSDRIMLFDIVAEDISMITTHRAEFSSLYAERGYDGMKKYIQDKLSKK